MKKARIEKGYTQQKLAEITGVKQGTISAIENGKRRPSVDVAKKIANVLNVDWTRFFTDERFRKESAHEKG